MDGFNIFLPFLMLNIVQQMLLLLLVKISNWSGGLVGTAVALANICQHLPTGEALEPFVVYLICADGDH